MSRLTLLAHLPLLRIEPREFSVDGGIIRQLPFEEFNTLTSGTHEDLRAAYEATAPVFLRFDVAVEPPEGSIHALRTRTHRSFEMKMLASGIDDMPTSEFGMHARLCNPGNNLAFAPISTRGRDALADRGVSLLSGFHRLVVERLRAALALAAPATLLPSPQMSVTFARLDESAAFMVGHLGTTDVVRIQGEADLEMLFHAPCAGAALDADALRHAAGLLPLVDRTREHPGLSGALKALLAAGAPTLSLADQSTLCTMALEALLLPEVRSGSAATFARRIASLLSSVPGDAERLESVGALLYDARSAGVHGRAFSPQATPAIDAAHAAQLLAAAIVEATRRLPEAGSLEALRATLDDRSVPRSSSAEAVPLLKPAGLRADRRISSPALRHTRRIFTDLADIAVPDGETAFYAPLVGLECSESFELGDGGPSVLPMAIPSVLALDRWNGVGDFVHHLMFESPVAALRMHLSSAVVSREESDGALLATMRRFRDLGVLALRLAGFDSFIDPALLGMYVLRGDRPLREPTILRQSVLLRLQQKSARTIVPADRVRTAPAWQLVIDYYFSDNHPELDRALHLFHRAHDRDFMPPRSRVTLMFALIESLLGRFRKLEDPVSLEHLVARLLGDPEHPAARWFAAQAREWRDRIAHGQGSRVDDPTCSDHLLMIGRAALRKALRTWLDAKRPEARPARLLIQRLTREEPGG